MSFGIAYNPCYNCKEMDKCSICELTYFRKGYIKSPTADAGEVVRCKDCKYKMTVNFNGEILIGCSNQSGLVDVCADGYCSYGERREK